MKQKQQTATQKKTKEKAEIPEESSSKPSVFSQNSTSAPSDSSAGVFSSDAETDGHIIGIDPGHQSESVDMSAPEPNGPGSSEMKAKVASGTSGKTSKQNVPAELREPTAVFPNTSSIWRSLFN